jgi:low affinity Fe/Cu permease
MSATRADKSVPDPGTDSRGAVARANVLADQAADRLHDGPVSRNFSKLANVTAHAAGRPATFALCCLVIFAWGITGPIFGFSDTWQLVVNTGTTIVTFLMVFLIQNTQNRDGAALQAKLDELIRASNDARNAFMGIERLPERELEEMRLRYADASDAPALDTDISPDRQ